MLINQDLIIPRIEDNCELLIYPKEKNNEYIQKIFNLIYQEINPDNIVKKIYAFRKVKKLEKKFIIYLFKYIYKQNMCTFIISEEDNLQKYKELKYYTRIGLYAGLMISNIEENILVNQLKILIKIRYFLK